MFDDEQIEEGTGGVMGATTAVATKPKIWKVALPLKRDRCVMLLQS